MQILFFVLNCKHKVYTCFVCFYFCVGIGNAINIFIRMCSLLEPGIISIIIENLYVLMKIRDRSIQLPK